MECNKEEAIRAKTIAEKKMINDDFNGARKLLLKAKNLFPSLENIPQLLTVCDVHCSAQNNIHGSEKDWYGILQIEKLADEAAIKKQYRKLALILHPDKNKYPGAEAAFKLIGQANMVLSDKGKKTLYDIKCRALVANGVPKPPINPMNSKNSNAFQQKTKASDFFTQKFNNLYKHQPAVYSSAGTFWTVCPFCATKYQYYRTFLCKSLRCQNCSQSFIAYEIGNQGPTPVHRETNGGSESVTRVSSKGEPPVFDPKKVQNKTFQKSAESPPQQFGSAGNSSANLPSDFKTRTGTTTEASQGSKKKVKNTHVTAKNDHVKVDTVKKAKQSRNSTKKNKNKRRKSVNSSESDTMSICDSEEMVCEEASSSHAGTPNSMPDNSNSRRSARLKQNVSYNENTHDLASTWSKSCDAKDKQNEPFNNLDKAEVNTKGTKRNRSEFAEGSSQYVSHEALNRQFNVEKTRKLDARAKNLNVRDETGSDLDTSSTLQPEIINCPEPEFSDFDKDKDETCFSVNQFWACYDTIDGMPRFYAQIKKVFSPGFKVRFVWLEADPQTPDETIWVDEGLPVGCGKFVRGEAEETSNRLTFSHQMYFVKGLHRGSYVVYPRRGEIWALYKDWDIKWSTDSENHGKYVFQIVEILSNFSKDGVKVVYMTKLKGFASLFERARGAVEWLIPSKELLRFSHQIPSSRMTGTEREGVPEGSYELDPLALPTNASDCWQPEVEVTERTNVKVTGSSSKPFDDNVKPTNYCGNAGMGNSKEVEKPQRSLMESNSTKKNAHVSSNPCSSKDGTAKHMHGSENASGCFTASKIKDLSGPGNEETYLATCKSPIDLTESPNVRRSCFGGKASEEVFHVFNLDKSEGKFQPGQIWALYGATDKLPNTYGQIKKIEASPFKLHVAFLETCKYNQPVCCGLFKFQNGKPKILFPSSFSHLMNVKIINKTKMEIYPKEGEVWAIYKTSDMSSSDVKDCAFDIVKIVKNGDSFTEVSSLVRVEGLKSVYRARRAQRSNPSNLMIPRSDLFRFSHQIPAYQLTGEKDGSLKGCWELDSAALPGHMFQQGVADGPSR